MRWIAVTAVGATMVATAVIWGLADAAGDPLARSSPGEVALRTARLAGIAYAVAGSAGEVSVVRLDLPAPASAHDVGIAWLTGLGLLAGSYPGSDSYVVQVFADGAPLVEFATPAGVLREAVGTGDIETVREGSNVSFLAESAAARVPSADVTPSPATDLVPLEEARRARMLLSAVPEGATGFPADAVAIGAHLPGGYLDAKNRAAGLLGREGLTAEGGILIAEAVDAIRVAAPALAAPEPGADVLAALVARLDIAVDGMRASGIDGLRAEVERLVAEGGRESIARARSLVASAEAVRLPGLDPSLSADVADVARSVREMPLREGPPSDAVRAAFGDSGVPRDAVAVREFQRDPSLDVGAADVAASQLLPARVLRLHGAGDPPTLEWTAAEDSGTVTAEAWLGYRRADGTAFWLAGEGGDVALVDASIHGWAYTTVRAALVDASRCGRVLAYFSAE